MEMRLAAMEGTEAAIATSSGMAAVMLMCFSLLRAGDLGGGRLALGVEMTHMAKLPWPEEAIHLANTPPTVV